MGMSWLCAGQPLHGAHVPTFHVPGVCKAPIQTKPPYLHRMLSTGISVAAAMSLHFGSLKGVFRLHSGDPPQFH
eukprot:4961993-Pyramimonas_sp.AAC.1